MHHSVISDLFHEHITGNATFAPFVVSRLAGVALVVPGINYWWPSLPASLKKAALGKLQASDRRAFWVARHAPRLLYAYMTQKLVTPSAILAGHPDAFGRQDKEILKTMADNVTSTTTVYLFIY